MGSAHRTLLPETTWLSLTLLRKRRRHARRWIYGQGCPVCAHQAAVRPVLRRVRRKFNMEHEIKKNEVEIHALELEVNDMHGKFIIPQLKKVSNFKLMGGEES